MVKQILIPLAAVAVFIILVGLFSQHASSLNLARFLPNTPTPTAHPLETMSVGNKTLQVEIANTEPSRELGLGGRLSLDQNSGMLFVFDSKPTMVSFWMKGMLIPLDMIWVTNGKVVQINKNIPVPKNGTPDSSLKTFSPQRPVDYVLEVNAGFSDRNSIKVGNPVSLPNL